MIPFAGYDPNEVPLTTRYNPESGAAFAYDLFRLGWDTLRISKRMNITEAKALNLVTVGRCHVIGKDVPYE